MGDEKNITKRKGEKYKKIKTPLVKGAVQNKIQQKVTESFKLRKQSKNLLECAKRAVEIAIEKSEGEAKKWLNKNMREATDQILP